MVRSLKFAKFADSGRSFGGRIRHPYGPDVYFGTKAGSGLSWFVDPWSIEICIFDETALDLLYFLLTLKLV